MVDVYIVADGVSSKRASHKCLVTVIPLRWRFIFDDISLSVGQALWTRCRWRRNLAGADADSWCARNNGQL